VISLQKLFAFIKLGRPQFLLGGFLFYGLGVFIAFYNGFQLNLVAFIWGQIAVTATQLMTHYANDAFDMDADRANLTPTNWSGGSRVLVSGTLSYSVALMAAYTLAAIAFIANLVLSLWLVPSLTTFLLLTSAQLLAWFYSAPPLRLHSQGIGEIAATLVVAVLTPLTGYYLQTGRIIGIAVLSVIPLVFLQLAMLISIEFADREGDLQVGKRTLAVRFGAAITAQIFSVLLVLTYATLPLLIVAGLPTPVAIAILICSPLALMQFYRIRRGDWHNPENWNHLGFYSIVLLMLTVFAELIAFIYLIAG
jgi:1,4-dihydroxy-2-naphthoate polyprenyltransferase